MQVSLRADDLKNLIEEIAPRIVKLKAKLKFDVIAFRGFSGASIAFPLSYETGIPLLLVRKTWDDGRPSDSSHGWAVEGDHRIDIKRYLILDDFVCSGDTIRQTVKTINQRVLYKHDNPNTKPKYPKLVGVALYMRGYRTNSSVWIDGYNDVPLTYIADSSVNGC
jgi:hypothetical protein